MSFRRFEHFSIGFGQSPPELGDLEEKGARRLVAYRPSRGSPVELPWNEGRRRLEAYRSSRGSPVELQWNENYRRLEAYLPVE